MFCVYVLLLILGSEIIPRTSTLTIRLPLDFLDELHKYAETLRLKPSVLASMILKDELEPWVKEYAKRVYDEVLD